MGKRDDLIAKYAGELRSKCGMEPDMALLEKVTIGCGPAIFDPEGEILDDGDPAALAHLKSNFLIRKLNLPDHPRLQDAIEAALDTYGRDEPRKSRAVLCYLLVKQLGREKIYG